LKKRISEAVSICSEILAVVSLNELKNRRIPIGIRLATACLDSKLLYNAETWTKIKTSDINKLETVQNNFCERLIGVPRGCPNAAIIQELGIIPVEYKIQIKKVIEYYRIITMTEERLTKKSVIKAEQIESISLLDDAYAILKKHNITYND